MEAPRVRLATIRQRCPGCGHVVWLSSNRTGWVCPVCDHHRDVV